MSMKIPRPIQIVIDHLNENGYEAYLVGGCVRDALLQKDCHDYDITTNARPSQIQALFTTTIPTGIAHGTVTIVIEEMMVEVTTYRTESEYKDHRHPDQVQFVNSLQEDLARRDFTINAMAYHPKEGLIDFFHGQEDLAQKKIRCVGNPETRFEEDALRMLRAHRFAAQLGFTIEKQTLKTINDHPEWITYVASERIVKELSKIMRYDPYEIENMTEMMSYFMPELKQAKACEQNSPWHDATVLHHTLRALRLMTPFDETVAFALLFHDLGKMSTKTTVDGRDHFYHHQVESAKLAKTYCEKLKLSNLQKKQIIDLVACHDDSLSATLKNVYRYRIELGFDDSFMKLLMEVKRCDILAHSPLGQKTIQKWKDFDQFYQKCIQERPLCLKDLCITGKDILEWTSLQGALIQKALNACLQLCFYSPNMNQRAHLQLFVKRNQKEWN